jgi:2-keto-myo-inositol isomerase
MSNLYSRRQLLQHTTQLSASGLIAAAVAAPAAAHAQQAAGPPQVTVKYCLNTSTIRGQKKSLVEEVELVAAAGYDAIEPWIGEIQAHVASGQSTRDLRKRIADHGLSVASAIGFAQWIVDDDKARAEALESLKRDMDLVQQIGGTRIAAPPAGATSQADLSLERAAERYARVLELGREMGVTPQLEVWGFSQSLSRLSEVMYVAIAAGDPDACLLPDVYHLFKGGSDFDGLALIAGPAIHVMHLNDYPGDVPREQMQDKHRVYPGDGVAPLPQIIRQLSDNGFRGTYSLELFNPDYWQQPVEEVLARGLASMQAAVTAASRS